MDSARKDEHIMILVVFSVRTACEPAGARVGPMWDNPINPNWTAIRSRAYQGSSAHEVSVTQYRTDSD